MLLGDFFLDSFEKNLLKKGDIFLSSLSRIRKDKTLAQLLLCHCEERQRRGNLPYYQYAMRLLHFVRNDREHIVQRFKNIF